MIKLLYPWALLLLFVPFISYVLLPTIKGMQGDALRIPFLKDLKRIAIKSGSIWGATSAGEHKFSFRFWALYAVWCLLVLSFTRPVSVGEPHCLPNEGRDIMLVLDISTSMLERDFRYQNHILDRLTAVKYTVREFVKKRANDRIGLILFGTRAYLQSPLTYDKVSVLDILSSMQAGMAGDSTSIGDALALALKNMRQSDNKNSQVIILLTDGENNDGSLSLAQAIKLAQDEDIKVYTIGVGSPDLFFKMLSFAGMSGLDESELKALAEVTKGEYFRATNTADLQKVYDLIDQLEAANEEENYLQEISEWYYIPLLMAFVLACSMIILTRKAAQ